MKPSFYLEFENKFRGSRQQVYDILSNYNGLIQYIVDTDKEPSLLDIGCGRGEWLQKCSNKGFKSIGLEINDQMVETCQNIGLEIMQGDAIDILKDLPENSFSLITAFHIIEHICFDSIYDIFVECKRILKKDGVLIIETPSIDNLSISSQNFYIDPTHINPINPDLLSFTLGRIGYDMVKVFYINGGPLQNEDQYSLTRVLNGVAQDVMMVATKSSKASLKLNENKSWIQSLKIGPSTIQACVDFDHQLRKKLFRDEETIRLLRARIYKLEKKLDMFFSSSLYKTLIFIFDRLIIARSNILVIRNIIMRILKKLISFILRKIYDIICNVFPNKFQVRDIYSKFINKLFNIFGYRFKNGYLLKMTFIPKEELDLVRLHEHKLDLNFERSSISKNLYEEIK